ETRFRLGLTSRGVPEPDLQCPVECRSGWRYLDLAWPWARVAAEYDGFLPHTGRRAFAADRLRLRELADLGWEVRVYPSADLGRLNEIAADMCALFARRAAGTRRAQLLRHGRRRNSAT
ncbi:MAG TPA: hypothetical protein VGN54_01790, partial [Mycobacteriales bacterium]|nr:hypothetical protein [Mycobacteriales bacterium]